MLNEMAKAEYLKELPLPAIITDAGTGEILYANTEAEASGLVKEQYYSENQTEAADCMPNGMISICIGGKAMRAAAREANIDYNNKDARLIVFTSLRNETDMPDEKEICALFLKTDKKKCEAEFLRMTGTGIGAFCAAFYEARSQRYVLREEWRTRRSASIPVLQQDPAIISGEESARLQKIKGASDIAILPYSKAYGTKGVAIYFFDKSPQADKLDTLKNSISYYAAFSPDIQNSSRFALHHGINSLEQGVAVWSRATRTLIYSNAAYRRMFGKESTRKLLDILGKEIRGNTTHETLTDGNGRFFDVTHTICGNRGDGVVSTILIDNTAYVKAQRRLDAMARTDALTGLMNRRAGLEYLEKQYGQCKRQGQPFTVCFADIDGLKHINDTWGHGAGDAMIQSVAEVLKQYVDKSGAVCRLGGDEFVLILPNQTAADASQISTQISREAAHCFVGDNDGIAMSFGIKQAEFTAGESAETLVSVADMEMYREKNRKSR